MLLLHHMKYPRFFFDRRHLCWCWSGWTNPMAWWPWSLVCRVTHLIDLAMSSKWMCMTRTGTSGCDRPWPSLSRLSRRKLWLTQGPFVSLVSFCWSCLVWVFVFTCIVNYNPPPPPQKKEKKRGRGQCGWGQCGSDDDNGTFFKEGSYNHFLVHCHEKGGFGS